MKIGIVGLGLIGGSLALDLKSLNHQILGVSRKVTTCEIAVARGVVDEASTELSLLQDSEIVIICTPIGAIARTLKQLIPYLEPNTIVTDVGSVKKNIVDECSGLWTNFIGGHPMAGTAEQGIKAAQSDLFQGAAYVFTPSRNTKDIDLEKLQTLAISVGAIPYICAPEVHDRAVAWISHLPVMVSASLITSCLGEKDAEVLKLAKQLASSGFRDTSRVGGGNPELGRMMAEYNSQALLRSLYEYRDNLGQIIKLIEQKKWDNLAANLQVNQQSRPDFLN
ncbi:prephenate dehydrogenase [Xenococcus sp. PCC 7305]|uniref:prephenate/arogenate dehydrogenase n=1 Tax=Xenococcus sp. PCC 7305 TaxID=102125 RepID=UPI0002AC171D|nr:prephenate/arogenate dehydrogenase [Xenococcus sp. PCC 7305]ELS02200.1 prephenate dehydrogenase [Xenococcus sp. PCC 7305]